jgi:four helix bundle protein
LTFEDTNSTPMASSRFQKWSAYQNAFDLAQKIFILSLRFPKTETYSLTDQIRRSSRSVCANLAEAYGKRSYPKHFRSKITDCQAENFETQSWLTTAYECKYINREEFNSLIQQSESVGKLLTYMYNNPKRYLAQQTNRLTD